MKRINVLMFALVIAACKLLAQDQIYKTDNTKLLVKIIEINPETIKYKLHSNPDGPVYSEPKNNVSLIIYEGGRHEVMNSGQIPSNASQVNTIPNSSFKMSRADSLIYFKHSQSISVNFLSFFNNEVGIIYQNEFYNSHFNIMIPLAVGIEKPNMTESVYFGSRYNEGYVTLTKKNIEAGFGINYYPSLETNFNYYIGPMFRFMQYSGTNNLSYPSPVGIYNVMVVKSEPTLVNRYCMSITNGLMIRTKSRLNANLFASMGFKNDATSTKIVSPVTNKAVNTLRPMSFYFWCGFNVGFCF